MQAGHVAVSAGLNPESTRAAILLSKFSAPDAVTDLVVRGLPGEPKPVLSYISWTAVTTFS